MPAKMSASDAHLSQSSRAGSGVEIELREDDGAVAFPDNERYGLVVGLKIRDEKLPRSA